MKALPFGFVRSFECFRRFKSTAKFLRTGSSVHRNTESISIFYNLLILQNPAILHRYRKTVSIDYRKLSFKIYDRSKALGSVRIREKGDGMFLLPWNVN
ncbi:hypothetical protein LEP1GSC047_3945 [Leptospira inadai serovar Lyme str. 10]|uniref:Uncharacterized protein n=2 Tax=Leptospira inadai serovar Lyme TaxID=293084 RepID=V6HCU1_9LEPT|nr:hypothetical protein LEP1GSC047_3945 [Leptospira inadai serovar Lyme str. 10]PNV75150.1 hypothetical protein BES34_009650 [Leptospira inadai serovar Lyme]